MTAGRSSLRRRLEWTLVGVALTSVLLLSVVNFVFAGSLINDSVERQLAAVRDTRIESFERSAARLQADVSTLGVSPIVIDALQGSTGSGAGVVPASADPLLRALMENAGMSDLLLVDASTNEVVYTVAASIDVGTSLTEGPAADSELGRVYDRLADVAIGDAVVGDASLTSATGGAVMFIGTTVRSGSEVLGSVIVELPESTVTALVTVNEGWERLGLGDTGDTYLVGVDGTMRTDSRRWLDDPDGYVADQLDRGTDPSITDEMTRLGSTVLLQRVDNRAVTAAQDGERFTGHVTSFDGSATLAASGPIEIANLDWVVVVEQARSESSVAFGSLVRGTLLVVGILVPVTILLGIVLARGLTRPFETLVGAASRMERGEPAPALAELGRNELGDVGRQLQVVAGRMAATEASILAEEQHITDALLAALPPRLVDRVRSGEQDIADIADTAAVVSVEIVGLPEAAGADQEVVLEILEQIGDELEESMRRFGVEPVRRSSSGGLFVAGLGHPDPLVDDAARFAIAVGPMVAAVGAEHGHDLTASVGIGAGDVATGVIGSSQLTFSVWGDPVNTAVTLSTIADPGEVLIDATIAGALGDGWIVGEPASVPMLADDVDAVSITLPDRATATT